MAIMDFNYDGAIRQARAIDDIASDMSYLADISLQNAIDAIRAGWTGEAANKLLAYCTEQKSKIRARASSLKSTASTIRSVAAQLEEAERRAKEQLLAQVLGGGIFR